MVKDANVLGADKYNEWMLIDDVLVQIGDTSVDLSGYNTSAEVDTKIKTVSDLLAEEIETRISNDSTHSTGIDEAKAAAKKAQENIDDLSGEVAALSEFIGELPEGATATTLVAYVDEKVGGVSNELTEAQKLIEANADGIEAANEAIKALQDAGVEKNAINAVKVDGVALAIAEDRSVEIPAATLAQLGLVKGSEAENSISINEDHTMTVNSLNVNKLAQDEGDWLILNGGSANI